MTGNAILDLLIVAVPAALISLWWTGSKAKELAAAHARRACQLRHVQFLDQTAALSHMRPVRTANGSQCFQRIYRFEFTDHGQYRDIATVTLHGHQLHDISFPYTRDPEGNRIYLQ